MAGPFHEWPQWRNGKETIREPGQVLTTRQAFGPGTVLSVVPGVEGMRF